MKMAAAFLLLPLVATGIDHPLGDPPAERPGTASPAVADGEEGVGLAYTVRWRAEAFGSELAGGALWLTGPDGALRLEVGLEEAAAESELLARRGRGWTLGVVPGGQTLLKAWQGPWREAGPALGAAVLEVVEAIAGGDRGRLDADRPRTRPGWMPRRSAGAGSVRIVAPAAGDLVTPASTGRTAGPAAAAGEPPAADRGPPAGPPDDSGRRWRRALAERGRGAGGPGEIWTVRRHGSRDGGWVARLDSSRRPGAVEVQAPRERPVRYPVPEVFLPLWALEDLLEPPAPEPSP